MYTYSQWAIDLWVVIKPMVCYITCTIKDKPIEFLTLIIAMFALSTWRSSLKAESNLKLHSEIISVLSQWSRLGIEVIHLTQPAKYWNSRTIDALQDARDLTEKISLQLEEIEFKVKFLDDKLSPHAEKRAHLLTELNDALLLNAKTISAINSFNYEEKNSSFITKNIDATDADAIKDFFKNINETHKIRTEQFEEWNKKTKNPPFSEIEPKALKIAQVANFLVP